jgi:hypothetical protein
MQFNLRARPRLSMMFTDPTDPFHLMSIQGQVVGFIDEDDPQNGWAATESINNMSARYLGRDVYPFRDSHVNEVRTLFRVNPLHAVVYEG